MHVFHIRRPSDRRLLQFFLKVLLSNSSPSFFTAKVFDLLVVETIRYTATVCVTSSHASPWTTVTVQEMKAWGERGGGGRRGGWGLLLYMAITVQPRLQLYWATRCPLNSHGDMMPCPSIDFSSCSGASI